MDSIRRSIIEQYHRERPDYIKLNEFAYEKLEKLIGDAGVKIEGMSTRVKSFASLEGKIFRYGEAAQKLSDFYDLVGIRIICYFTEDVELVCRLIEDNFVIDWEKSGDQRDNLGVDAFGYRSFHYICCFRDGSDCPEALYGKRFEIQVRTLLQHAWAQMEHDLGYKTDFGVPAPILRAFARLAGLLELADDEFSRLKAAMHDYTEATRQKIVENKADDVALDSVSIREYMANNIRMSAFLAELGEATGTEVTPVDPIAFLEPLDKLGKTKIGDLQDMLENNREAALSLAVKSFKGSELDIMSSNIALRYLCAAELMRIGCTKSMLVDFLRLMIKNPARAEKYAESLLDE